jgi:hypothetical protein
MWGHREFGLVAGERHRLVPAVNPQGMLCYKRVALTGKSTKHSLPLYPKPKQDV